MRPYVKLKAVGRERVKVDVDRNGRRSVSKYLCASVRLSVAVFRRARCFRAQSTFCHFWLRYRRKCQGRPTPPTRCPFSLSSNSTELADASTVARDTSTLMKFAGRQKWHDENEKKHRQTITRRHVGLYSIMPKSLADDYIRAVQTAGKPSISK